MARIALVHDIAGIARVQAELLRSAGHVVDEIALPGVGAAWNWPVKGVALPLRLAAYAPAIRRIRGGNYDVVHIHWLPNGIVGVLSGRQFFVQAHGSDLHVNLSNPVYRRVTRSVLGKAKKVFYVTPNLKQYLTGYEDKLVYLPNPVEMRGIAARSAPPTRVQRVLVFTRIDPVKGVDRIFPAVEALSATVDVSALDWGPLASKYAKRYGDHVKFVPTVPHERIGTFLQQFDVAIGQMRQGILSLMEVEAMVSGRPLITGVDPELYRGDPPPVVRATGPEEIVEAVGRLRALSAAELATLSREGREWALRNHSYAHHLELLEETYFRA